MSKTFIEWTDDTWNPVTGCSEVSPGCDHCYAARMATRLRGRFGYPQDEPFRVTLHPDKLWEPFHWKRPRRVFVCSMSDLFHRDVPWSFIEQVFGVMAIQRHITFQVLTKRPGRMAYFAQHILTTPWPPNVWAGTSVESARYLPRLDVLARVPARVRFVSAEPLLGPLDLRPWLVCSACADTFDGQREPVTKRDVEHCGNPRLNWVIVGGESGPGARPMHLQWARDIRDQCQEAGVPFFFKQWGEYASIMQFPGGDQGIIAAERAWKGNRYVFPDGDGWLSTGQQVFRVGKKAAGRELDGRTWKEFPGDDPDKGFTLRPEVEAKLLERIRAPESSLISMGEMRERLAAQEES